MLSNLSSMFFKLNNIKSNKDKFKNINTNIFNPLLISSLKKNMNNYITLSNQKSFEIYRKYNTNTLPRFRALNTNAKPEPSVCEKYINSVYFLIGCFYIFLASFTENINLLVV